MKVYSKPIIEILAIQTEDCFMAMAGSGDHGEIPLAPKRREPAIF